MKINLFNYNSRTKQWNTIKSFTLKSLHKSILIEIFYLYLKKTYYKINCMLRFSVINRNSFRQVILCRDFCRAMRTILTLTRTMAVSCGTRRSSWRFRFRCLFFSFRHPFARWRLLRKRDKLDGARYHTVVWLFAVKGNVIIHFENYFCTCYAYLENSHAVYLEMLTG